MGLAARGCRIEISLMLLAGDSPLRIETIETSEAPEPFGHQPQAVKAGSFLFFSTQLPVDSQGRIPAELKRHPAFPYAGQPPKLQLRYMLKNIVAICEKAGSSLENICRCQTFYDDLIHFAPMCEEWQAHFPNDPPAMTALQVGGPLLVPGAHMLLDLIGYVPD
ncbi:MAG TPA: RidA family protein [Candidatus Binatia bacterium]|nr:RidA family protein [Candidatus Binatia bacterium]